MTLVLCVALFLLVLYNLPRLTSFVYYVVINVKLVYENIVFVVICITRVH